MSKLIWITGLAGSGKTTIAQRVYNEFKSRYANTVMIDGDDFREIIGNKLGHSREERFKVAMQIARLCKFLTKNGINVVCATISLFKEIHDFNRSYDSDYLEIFIDCKMAELKKRDKKNLYSKAIAGKIKNVWGVDLHFDQPDCCHLHLKNNTPRQLEDNIQKILTKLNL